ncbi:FAD binding domain-containing protein [Nakamurella sp. A5-74]|uniref:FAD binding domain-containing protein n=1 Tax=Nakamurella sp. A5-74 TaxID=3158264 RepID=A0AAU8DQ47_9ACTN
MKPPPFTWHGPRSVDEAIAVLGEVGSEGKVLAGGQSLLPVLAMRLAAPAHLVDINAVEGLDTITVDASGVTIGALVRHTGLLRHPAAGNAQPLIPQALSCVAHATIRNRGTTVGSLAHADPSGEMTSVLALLGGSITAQSTRGARTIAAADFFVGPLESTLAPDELVVSAHFPGTVREPGTTSGTAFAEIARRHGDYALCGVAAIARVDAGGALLSLRCGYLSVSEVPLVLELTDAWNDSERAAVELARVGVDPSSDIHATAEYRRSLAGVLTARVARTAIAKARSVPELRAG